MNTSIVWAEGYAAGSSSGARDRIAEQDGAYQRGDDGPTPPDGDHDWVDGFLTGYAHGAAIGGAA